jgi:hypothetical protein
MEFTKRIMKFLFRTFILLMGFQSGFAQTTQTFTSSGTFTVPAGVTEITVELWGGGGSGGNVQGGSGGGGGGAYTRAVLTVAPGNSFTVTVGGGGVATASGGTSSFAGTGFTTVNANGGSGAAGTSGALGATAQTISGTIVAAFAGGNGAGGFTNGDNNRRGGGGGGGSAFTNAAGGNGTAGAQDVAGTGGNGTGKGGNGGISSGSASIAQPGQAPGGGGGGAAGGSTDSGNGARGEVRITYIAPTVTALRIAGAETATAGTEQNVTITAVDSEGDTDATYTGTKSLTFSGASISPNDTAPLAGGVEFGTAVDVEFTSGVATVPITLFAAETATVSVTDGSVSSSGANRWSVTVSNAGFNALNVDVGDPRKLRNQAFDITVSLVDLYGNQVLNTGSTSTITLTSNKAGSPAGQLELPVLGSENTAEPFTGTIPVGQSSFTFEGLIYTGISVSNGDIQASATASGGTANGLTGTRNFSVRAASLSVTAAPSTLFARGTTTLTARYLDEDPEEGDEPVPVEGIPVRISIDAIGQTNQINDWESSTTGTLTGGVQFVEGVTDANGEFSTILTASGTPGEIVVRAQCPGACPAFDLITVLPGTANAANSTVTASPLALDSNGSESTTITVTLRDASGNNIEGQTVRLTQGLADEGTSSATISDASLTTNASGVAVFTATNNTTEVVRFRAVAGEEGKGAGEVNVTQSVDVVFAPPFTFASATTTSDGTAVLVTFNENVSEPAGFHTEFSLEQQFAEFSETLSFSEATLVGDRVIRLTVAGSPIAAGSTLGLTYTPGTFTSLASYPLIAFANEPVSNVTRPKFRVYVQNSDDGDKITEVSLEVKENGTVVEAALTNNGDGFFNFTVTPGVDVVLTPSKTDVDFVPLTFELNNVTTDQLDVVFDGTVRPPPSPVADAAGSTLLVSPETIRSGFVSVATVQVRTDQGVAIPEAGISVTISVSGGGTLEGAPEPGTSITGITDEEGRFSAVFVPPVVSSGDPNLNSTITATLNSGNVGIIGTATVTTLPELDFNRNSQFVVTEGVPTIPIDGAFTGWGEQGTFFVADKTDLSNQNRWNLDGMWLAFGTSNGSLASEATPITDAYFRVDHKASGQVTDINFNFQLNLTGEPTDLKADHMLRLFIRGTDVNPQVRVALFRYVTPVGFGVTTGSIVPVYDNLGILASTGPRSPAVRLATASGTGRHGIEVRVPFEWITNAPGSVIEGDGTGIGVLTASLFTSTGTFGAVGTMKDILGDGTGAPVIISGSLITGGVIFQEVDVEASELSIAPILVDVTGVDSDASATITATIIDKNGKPFVDLKPSEFIWTGIGDADISPLTGFGEGDSENTDGVYTFKITNATPEILDNIELTIGIYTLDDKGSITFRGPPSKISLTGPGSINAGVRTGGFTLTVFDINDIESKVREATVFALSSDSDGTIGFFADAEGAPFDPARITVASGTSSVNFFYRDTKANDETTVTAEWSSGDAGLNGDVTASASHSFEVVSGTPTQLVYTNDAREITAGETSEVITVRLLDENANPAVAGEEGVTLALTSVPAGVTFRNLADNANITQVVVAAGQNEAPFRATGTTAGIYTLTSDAGEGLSATQNFTINAGEASQIAINAGDGQSATVGQQTGMLISTLAQPSVSGFGPGSGNIIAQPLLTGASDQWITEVYFDVRASVGTLTAAIRADNDGVPGELVATLGSVVVGDIAGAEFETVRIVADSSLKLNSETLYWITIQGSGGDPQFRQFSTTVFDSGSIWTRPDATTNLTSSNGGSSWSGSSENPLAFGIFTSPTVVVRDASDNVVSGVDVSFAIATGGGSFAGSTDPVVVQTDANGIAASPVWTLGTTAGANTLTATSGSLTGSPLTFTATGTAGAPAQLVFTTDERSVVARNTSDLMTVQLRDASGNVAVSSGTTVVSLSADPDQVTFRAEDDTTTLTSLDIEDGTSSVSFLASSTFPGEFTITANAGSGGLTTTQNFTVTNTAPVLNANGVAESPSTQTRLVTFNINMVDTREPLAFMAPGVTNLVEADGHPFSRVNVHVRESWILNGTDEYLVVNGTSPLVEIPLAPESGAYSGTVEFVLGGVSYVATLGEVVKSGSIYRSIDFVQSFEGVAGTTTREQTEALLDALAYINKAAVPDGSGRRTFELVATEAVGDGVDSNPTNVVVTVGNGATLLLDPPERNRVISYVEGSAPVKFAVVGDDPNLTLLEGVEFIDRLGIGINTTLFKDTGNEFFVIVGATNHEQFVDEVSTPPSATGRLNLLSQPATGAFGSATGTYGKFDYEGTTYRYQFVNVTGSLNRIFFTKYQDNYTTLAPLSLSEGQKLIEGYAYINTSLTPSTDGRTLNFGVFSGGFGNSPAQATIVITDLNNAPSGADKIVSMFQGGTYTFKAADFGFSDINGDALEAVKITTLPDSGTLELDGVAVTAGQFVPAAEIADLVYTPGSETTGRSFTFQVQDDGGTENGGTDLDPTPNTISFTVLDVQAIADQIFTNEAIEPTVVIDGATFTVSYSSNTELGTATITITGTDDFAGATTTTTFQIVPGPVASFEIKNTDGNDIGTQTAGTAFNVRIRALDAFGNVATGFTGSVALTSTGTLSGTPVTSGSFTAGVLASQSVTITNTGNFTLAASDGGDPEEITGISNSFDVEAGAPTQLAFVAQPQNAVIGASTGEITVEILDVNGNRVTNNTSSVTLSIGNNAGSGTLSGTATVNAVAGLATFSGLSINKVGEGYTLSAASTGLTSATSSDFDVTSKALTLSGTFTAQNKVYDGNDSATIDGTNLSIDGLVDGSDSVTLDIEAIFSQTTVGENLTVSLTGTTLTGDDAANYTLSFADAPTATANITPKELTITGLTGDNKVYDGNTTATASGDAALAGVIGADTDNVVLGGTPAFTFASADVADGISITTTGYTISGDAADNYTLTQPAGLTANITAATLASLNFALATIADQVFTGSAIEPGVVVSDGDTTLVVGTDYTVAYANNVNVGTATATVTGTGNYSGELSEDFEITPATLASLNFALAPIADEVFTGSAIEPGVVVSDGDTTLVVGTDYTVAYANNVNVGTATATVTGTGNYSGELSEDFEITPATLASLNFALATIADQVFTGSAIEPGVVVSDGDTTLVVGTDYTVAYANNVNVGTATATVTGTGNYSGELSEDFEITAATLASLNFALATIADQVFTGSAIEPGVVVSDGDTTLVVGTDYTVAYANNVNVGTATATVTGTGNYSGELSEDFEITPATLASLNFALATIADQVFTGSAIEPGVVVSDGDTTLVVGTDYTVAYANNVNVGTATATVTGTGNYSGELSEDFEITPATLASLNFALATIADQVFTGSAIEPGVVVSDGDTTWWWVPTTRCEQCECWHGDGYGNGHGQLQRRAEF